MLVLSRRKFQEIIVGDGIRVTICDVRGDTVKVGIEAPRELNIARAELVEDCAVEAGDNR